MKEGCAIGLVGVLLAAIGAALLLIDALRDLGSVSLNQLSRFLFELALVLVAFVAAAVMYRSRYAAGGVLGIVVGVAIVVVPSGSLTAGILVVLGGVLGVIAAEVKK